MEGEQVVELLHLDLLVAVGATHLGEVLLPPGQYLVEVEVPKIKKRVSRFGNCLADFTYISNCYNGYRVVYHLTIVAIGHEL